jgi:putative membrane protein
MTLTWKNGALLASAGLLMTLSGSVIAQSSNSSSKSTGSSASTAASTAKSSGKVSAADMKFARDAAVGGLMEVQMGMTAEQKASNDKVKQFGQKMVNDHSKANDQLMSIASKKNITLPTEIDAKHKKAMEMTSKMSGTGFARDYMRDMVRDHETDVAEFQKEANSGSDPDLKNFAAMTLPTLQQHLQMAKDIDSSLGQSSSKSK